MQFNRVSKTHVAIIRCVLKGEECELDCKSAEKTVNPSQSKHKHKNMLDMWNNYFVIVPIFDLLILSIVSHFVDCPPEKKYCSIKKILQKTNLNDQ